MDGFLPNVIKYLLFATNFLVFLMGCIVLGFGIFALVDGEELANLVSLGAESLNLESGSGITLYTTSAVILIVVSVFVVIVTFFGCCGAIKENKCMLGTYFTIVLAMFIVMIVGAVIGYNQSLDEIKKPLLGSMTYFDKNGTTTNERNSTITKAWNTVQKDYTCCGVDNYLDWSKNGTYPPVGDQSLDHVPKSCCEGRSNITNIEECQKNPQKYAGQLNGCFEEFKSTIEQNAKNILAVGVTIVVIMFLNMLFAFALCTMVH